MPFRPLNDRHAIQEVVFVLSFSRPFKAGEMDAFASAHDAWQGELHKLNRDGFSIVLQQGPAAAELPPLAVSFDSFNRDGSFAWRMRAFDNWLAVNCLAYSRWADIWPQARSLLKRGAQAIARDDNPLGGVALQYIDVFVWEGDIATYQLNELLREDSDFVPRSLWGKGHLWHLHQGFFREEGLPDVGQKMLDRMHIDVQPAGQNHIVKFDNTQRLDFRRGFVANVLFEKESAVDEIFERLHMANKIALSGYLSVAMSQRIALNV